MMEKLIDLLERSAARHHRLCPRQVLGVRIGMVAGKILGLELPQTDKRLFAFAECDGCGMGGMAVATGCFVERRTMRVLDYGKLAGTFVDTQTGKAIRIHPRPDSREIALQSQPGISDSWQAQLEAYQVLPDEQLLTVEPVILTVALQAIISQPGARVTCARCSEEVMNERWIVKEGKTICRTCAGESYFSRVD